MRTLDERFWSKVERPNPEGCWNWTANKNNKGYGLFRPGGVAPKALAHRLSYEAANGPIPKGGLILHSCDNPACVNPAHLRVGSHKANVADMDQRGRRVSNAPKGAANHNAFATDDQIIAMLREYVAGARANDLADKYGFTRSAVRDPLGGKSWSHLLGKAGAPTLADLKAAARRERRNGAKITAEDARAIKARLAAGETGVSIAARYGIHKATVSDIKCGKIWADA